ncbi:unnamed protein product [Arctogadus glacialis]
MGTAEAGGRLEHSKVGTQLVGTQVVGTGFVRRTGFLGAKSAGDGLAAGAETANVHSSGLSGVGEVDVSSRTLALAPVPPTFSTLSTLSGMASG